MHTRSLAALLLCVALGCGPEQDEPEESEAFEVIQINTPPIDSSYAASQQVGLRIVYPVPTSLSTTVAVQCAELASHLNTLLLDTLIIDTSVRSNVRQLTRAAMQEGRPNRQGFGIDTRKWVVFQPATSSADTLCLGNVSTLEREGEVIGAADSLVAYVNGLVY